MSAASLVDRSALLSESLRDDFPILNGDVLGGQSLAFLDNAASTQRPRQVIDAIRRVYERDYANVHRGIHTLSERSTEQYEQAREKVRALINARSRTKSSLHRARPRRSTWWPVVGVTPIFGPATKCS